MIPLKHLLAENMIRFKAKNLSASVKQNLQRMNEQAAAGKCPFEIKTTGGSEQFVIAMKKIGNRWYTDNYILDINKNFTKQGDESIGKLEIKNITGEEYALTKFEPSMNTIRVAGALKALPPQETTDVYIKYSPALAGKTAMTTPATGTVKIHFSGPNNIKEELWIEVMVY